jgi:hypothetical protein
MRELLDRHLDDVAIQMGGFLRGFENSSIHLGTKTQFAREFRRVLREPLLRTFDNAAISYSQAVESWHLPAIETEALDPLSTLMRGLRGQKIINDIITQEISVDSFYEELRRLLRQPRLRFFLTVSNPQLLQDSVEGIAKQMGLPFTFGTREEAKICPSCGNTLANPKNSPIVCSRCGIEFESFIEQLMVPSVLAIVSYDMLREVLALDLVENYQEESAIRPTHTLEALP